MTIFNEHFPSEKLAVQQYAERQKQLKQFTISLNSHSNPENSQESPSTSIIEAPKKQSWSEIITEIQRDVEEKLRVSSEIDAKIKEIHEKIETVDEINSIIEDQKEIIGKISADESRLESIGQLSELDVEEISIQKRVHALEQKDSSSNLSNYKPPKIKSTKASILKSKFNAERSISFTSAKSLPKPSKPSFSSLKFEVPKKAESKKINASVRKILNDAKEKHKARKCSSNCTNVPINVVDLCLM